MKKNGYTLDNRIVNTIRDFFMRLDEPRANEIHVDANLLNHIGGKTYRATYKLVIWCNGMKKSYHDVEFTLDAKDRIQTWKYV